MSKIVSFSSFSHSKFLQYHLVHEKFPFQNANWSFVVPSFIRSSPLPLNRLTIAIIPRIVLFVVVLVSIHVCSVVRRHVVFSHHVSLFLHFAHLLFLLTESKIFARFQLFNNFLCMYTSKSKTKKTRDHFFPSPL